MATKRIKDITNTAASVASDAYLAIDGTSNGTEKITRDNFRQDTADAFVAAPGTYNLAPLSGGAVEVAKGGTGATTAAGARTNLGVNGIDEDAQANALKTTPPALYFNGSSSEVTVADDDKFSFTDNVDDLPFSISAWVKIDSNASDGTVLSKFDSAVANREYRVYYATNNRIYAERRSITGADLRATYSSANPFTIGDWVHLCVVYNAAGPNTSTAFSSATQQIFVNGADVTDTSTSTGTYTGMSNTAGDIRIGSRANADYLKGSIRDVKIFNRTLTASEVAELARGNDLGFSEEWGEGHGDTYASDFSAGVDGFTDSAGTVAGNIDSIGGQDDNLRLTVDATSANHYIKKIYPTVVGKRYRVELDYYIPSGNSDLDGIIIRDGSTADIVSGATTDAWTRLSGEYVAQETNHRIHATSAGNRVFQDAGGDDVLYIRNVTVTEIGTLADFRAERYDTSTNKLYDLSDNAFVGTGTSVSLTGREVPVYSTGTWTPSITFGGGSTGITYATQEGYYTRIGNQVTAYGTVTLTAKGSSTGNANLAGLPFRARNTTGFPTSFTVAGWNMASLQSPITGIINENSTLILLYDTGATGNSNIDETNFTDTTYLRFSVTYQIQ